MPPQSLRSHPSWQASVAGVLARSFAWLRLWWPQATTITWHERLRVATGIGLCVALVALCDKLLGSQAAPLWLVASLGSSALLVIAMPSSPLAQPWPVVAGSGLSFAIGLLCVQLLPQPLLAAAAAVGLAVLGMLALRCLHPPGGALALYAVLYPQAGLAALPSILFNVVVLVLVAIAYNHLTGRSYPQRQASANAPTGAGGFVAADLDEALAHYDGLLDVSRADLEGLLHRAGRAAFQRTLGEQRCQHIMSTPVHAVTPDSSLQDAWALMHRQAIKALPVVDAQQQVVGIITLADFMRQAHQHSHEGLGRRLRVLILGRPKQPRQVQELMSGPVQQVQAEQHVMDLVPLFSTAGHHHFPVVNAQQQLVGIITQTDLVKALAAAVSPP